jgi:hypothetical protein
MMESQLNQLDGRLKRREKELLSQIDDARTNHKLERARALAQHQQELLEKDEQLLKFQTELEFLVRCFQQQQTGKSGQDPLVDVMESQPQ